MVQTGRPAQTPVPDFKFEEENAGDAPGTVRALTAADLYVINYVDKAGKVENRLCAVVTGKKGGHKVFMFQEKIQNVQLTVSTAPWFEEAVSELLKGGGEEGVASV